MIITRGNLNTLYVGFNASYREGFGTAEPDHQPITMTVPSTTRTAEYGWLGQVSSFREWLGERVLRGIASHGYSIRNKTFENTVEVSREDIEDDNIGLYGPLFSELGLAAAVHPCELVYNLLKAGFDTPCYDGQYFFDTDHPDHDGNSVSNDGGGNGTAWFLVDASRRIKPIIFQSRRAYKLTRMDMENDQNTFLRNTYVYGVDGRCNAGYGLWQLAYGSKDILNAANYEKARAALLSMKGDGGRPMGVRPTHLIVPPTLEKQARQLLVAENDAAGATNVWQGSAQIIATPWLA